MSPPDDQSLGLSQKKVDWQFRLRKSFIGAAFVSLGMWAVLLALIFTGHTKIIWTAREAVKVSSKAMRKAHHAVERLNGEHAPATPK